MAEGAAHRLRSQKGLGLKEEMRCPRFLVRLPSELGLSSTCQVEDYVQLYKKDNKLLWLLEGRRNEMLTWVTSSEAPMHHPQVALSWPGIATLLSLGTRWPSGDMPQVLHLL